MGCVFSLSDTCALAFIGRGDSSTFYLYFFFFFNDTATTEIYTLHIVGSVRCVQETEFIFLIHLLNMRDIDYNFCKENSLFKFEDYKKFMDSNFTSSDEILSLQSVIKDFLMSYTCLLYTSPSPRDQA
eukprot:TRINITY_DN7992_c0_g1_i1.p1 TRINITY_DN7992_c0_g1~~TRINITY_DN7992_c0_g1_i1.p1  ORF type:complete len:128 (-),score=29.11 TRINITY_DN7992_c0_g1_i1:84-467(-)